jgi:hypothetical protein
VVDEPPVDGHDRRAAAVEVHRVDGTERSHQYRFLAQGDSLAHPGLAAVDGNQDQPALPVDPGDGAGLGLLGPGVVGAGGDEEPGVDGHQGSQRTGNRGGQLAAGDDPMVGHLDPDTAWIDDRFAHLFRAGWLIPAGQYAVTHRHAWRDPPRRPVDLAGPSRAGYPARGRHRDGTGRHSRQKR